MKYRKALTEAAVKNAKPQAKDYKLSDGGGLYLLVTPKGGKYWRYKYRVSGLEKKGSLGAYPEVTIKEARDKHDAARKLVDTGADPVEEARRQEVAKRAEEDGDRPFREIAQEWLAVKYPPTRRARLTIKSKGNSLNKLNAGFGDLPLKLIKVRHLANVLQKCEAAETYATRERVQQDAIAIMGYAQGLGLIEYNPFLGVKFTAAFTSSSETHESRPAIVDPGKFGLLLRDIDRRVVPNHDKRTRHAPINRLALRILALTFVRPGELVKAEWSHINWHDAKLVVPFATLKQRTSRKKKKSPRANKDFEVPLSRQALADLKELHNITGSGRFLFPARPSRWGDLHQVADKTIAEPTLNAALNRIGYQDIHCAHGFRSTASTMLNAERVTMNGSVFPRWVEQKAMIEVQLDHDDASTQAIYDRGGRWEERAEMMQLWADRIDEMRGGGGEAARPKPKLMLVA